MSTLITVFFLCVEVCYRGRGAVVMLPECAPQQAEFLVTVFNFHHVSLINPPAFSSLISDLEISRVYRLPHRRII